MTLGMTSGVMRFPPQAPAQIPMESRMPELDAIYDLIGLLPFDCLHVRFMQQAFLALCLLAPMTAILGVLAVSFRMAFFADAISHSAFAGVALGLVFAVSPTLTMPVFGLLVGLGIMAVQRRSRLAPDTVIGVFFAAAMAFGLAVISRNQAAARDMQMFLYGDILTISDADIHRLLLLFLVLAVFHVLGYNRLVYISFNAVLARAHGIHTGFWQYAFAGLLALVVMFSVRAVGVFLVPAMLIIPAATARNLARGAGGMFWWALAVSLSSAVAGLIVSAQDWARTATGATVILLACLWFVGSLVVGLARKNAGRAA
jgi:zinc transport system permease protein